MIGAALGGNFDRGIKMGGQFDMGDQSAYRRPFFTTTFSVMGHVAKADGHVSASEIAAARNIMAQMQLSAAQRKAAVQFFDQGKVADFPLQELLHQFKKECRGRRNLIQMFVEIQIATALADGKVDANEKRILYTIGEILGFARDQIDHLFNMANAQHASSNDSLTLTQAYKVLGIDKNSTSAEVKKAYRRLMNQHHPDKLVSKGLPDEMIQLATEKTQEIRKAYDLIKDNTK